MAITIIVEDGSGVADANAYVSVANVRAYAANRGVTLPSSDDEVAAWLIKATDYLEAMAGEYVGQKTDAAYSLEWPRNYVTINCVDLASNAIPKQLINAQCALVLVQNEGLVLQPNIKAADYVIEETVGPITTKYADPANTVGIAGAFTAVDALLAPLLRKQGIALSATRV